jgi:hypothetical protein
MLEISSMSPLSSSAGQDGDVCPDPGSRHPGSRRRSSSAVLVYSCDKCLYETWASGF